MLKLEDAMQPEILLFPARDVALSSVLTNLTIPRALAASYCNLFALAGKTPS